jgi:hypothetical protein
MNISDKCGGSSKEVKTSNNKSKCGAGKMKAVKPAKKNKGCRH